MTRDVHEKFGRAIRCRLPQRWLIFAFLFGFGLLAYVQQKSLTIAADGMMPELGLSQLQIGWLEQAFVLGYAIFQLPSGVFGQRYGARISFTLFGLLAFMAVVTTPFAPLGFSGGGLFAVLLAAQLVLGIAQAGIFPVSAGVFETWFPLRQWSLVQGLQSMGLQLGAALTPPLIASLSAAAGWQHALVWSSLPALLLIAAWARYGRDAPVESASTSAEKDQADKVGQREVNSTTSMRRVLSLLGNRNALLLAGSYLLMNYTFYLLSNWCFLYLIQERHLSALESGWLSTAPPLAAALGAGAGGLVTGRLCKRFGDVWGFRAVPLVALPLAAGLLMAAILASHAYWAVTALTLCYFCVELSEGAFWASAMMIGRSDTMTLGGFMNTGGNFGGILGIPIVAFFSGRHAWFTAFAIGSVCAVISALLWLGIDSSKIAVLPASTNGD